MFEYATLVSTIGLTKKAEEATPAELAKVVSVSLGKAVATTAKGLEKLQGGGWEIISHQITPVSHTLVVSFLCKREKRETPPESPKIEIV